MSLFRRWEIHKNGKAIFQLAQFNLMKTEVYVPHQFFSILIGRSVNEYLKFVPLDCPMKWILYKLFALCSIIINGTFDLRSNFWGKIPVMSHSHTQSHESCFSLYPNIGLHVPFSGYPHTSEGVTSRRECT